MFLSLNVYLWVIGIVCNAAREFVYLDVELKLFAFAFEFEFCRLFLYRGFSLELFAFFSWSCDDKCPLNIEDT